MTTTAKKLRQVGGPYYKEIGRLTGNTPEDLAWIIYEAGIWWLRKEGLMHLEKCWSFWNDFKYSWYARDAEFIGKVNRLGVSINYKEFHYHRLEIYRLDDATQSKISQQLKQHQND